MSKITVKKIADECGINRNTFYYYFVDIPDLVRCVMKELAENNLFINNNNPPDSIEVFMEEIVNALLEHHSFLTNIFSADFLLTTHLISQNCEEMAKNIIQLLLKEKRVSSDDYEFLVDYARMILLGMIMDWVLHGMSVNVLTKVKRLQQLNVNHLSALLEKCLQNYQE